MRVFKFGGASVKDASAVENVGKILDRFRGEQLIIVVSAMGKTTNALEAIMASHASNDATEALEKIEVLKAFHLKIISGLFESKNAENIRCEIIEICDWLIDRCRQEFNGNYHFEYDQIISLGEVMSTKIISAYLNEQSYKCSWIDARKVIRTDGRWREARVNWDESEKLVRATINGAFDNGSDLVITQGFLGHNDEGYTTTLGREGSDFTASILAYIMEAQDVTIWKDVPGMLNADPKYFDNTVLLEKISFKEAIELAYFGASVIHPKTIQPLKRKKIPLYIKSFISPDEQGSVIQESLIYDDQIPSFIFKMDQVLISLTPRDFSFIVEENLEKIFGYLNKENVRINLMQNSAVSFSFCVDGAKTDLDKLVDFFQEGYLVKYNRDLELVTIRHYDDPTIERVTAGKKIILEQKARQTARLIISD